MDGPAPNASTYRGRFAPSPTGPLHFGSLVAAFGSWLFARQAGGVWLVRIEDLDPPRERPGAADEQLATLARFGLHSDEPVIRQSERGPLYLAAVERLLAQGDAFACRCSRTELALAGAIHRQCVSLDADRPAAIRLRIPETTLAFEDAVQGRYCQELHTEVGDFVIRRNDGLWAYQLAVVVDDAAQGITDVVRGADLLDSTPRQILLQRRLGLPTPRYVHLPLVRDSQGRKFSKSLAALPVDGLEPIPALRAAWRFLGQADDALPDRAGLSRLLDLAVLRFDAGRVPRESSCPAVMDSKAMGDTLDA